MSYTRFDLEQDILACWSVVDDLKTLKQAVNENDTLEVGEYIKALSMLYDLKFNRLWATFEKHLSELKNC